MTKYCQLQIFFLICTFFCVNKFYSMCVPYVLLNFWWYAFKHIYFYVCIVRWNKKFSIRIILHLSIHFLLHDKRKFDRFSYNGRWYSFLKFLWQRNTIFSLLFGWFHIEYSDILTKWNFICIMIPRQWISTIQLFILPKKKDKNIEWTGQTLSFL